MHYNYKQIYLSFLLIPVLSACGGGGSAGGSGFTNSDTKTSISAVSSSQTSTTVDKSSTASSQLAANAQASSQPQSTSSLPSSSSSSSSRIIVINSSSSVALSSNSASRLSSNPSTSSSSISGNKSSDLSSNSSSKVNSSLTSSLSNLSSSNSSLFISSSPSSSSSSKNNSLSSVSSSKSSTSLSSLSSNQSKSSVSSSVTPTLLWSADFNDGVVLGSAQSGAVASIENGAYKVSYPQATSGGQYSWLNYDPPANTKQLYISFKAKMPGNKAGLKFLKVFGEKGPGGSYSNTTFGLDYTAIDDGIGTLYAIAFGDGTDPQNDSQNVIFLSGDNPSWIGRSYGKTATVKTPMKKNFRAIDWGTDWHTFKIMVKFNEGTSTANEVANGAYYVEIDGNVYVDATGLFNHYYNSGDIGHIEFGGWAQGSRNAVNPAFDIYYDDIVVSSGGWINLPATSVSSSSKSSTSSPSSSSKSSSSSSKSSNSSSSIRSSSSSSSSSQTSAPGSSSSTSSLSSSLVYGTAGLLWPNGIEPGDPSICEAPNGKRCWWVDANASSGGNGNYTSPYNSFQLLEQNIHGGDFVYVRGTFDMATNSASHQMTLNFYTTAASGTASDPTTLKSWRGSPRAVFSSNRTSAQVRMTRNGGVRVQNIEITNFGDVGISVDETVKFVELINIVAHDGRVTQSSGIGGGVRLYAQDILHTFIVRNSLFENTSAASETGDNVGALSIISEPTAQLGSTIKVYDNIFRNNFVAIRHKHAGQVHMEAYRNLIENNTWGFNLRAWSSDIHHNTIVGNKTGIVMINQNANANHDYTIRYNTFYNNNYLLQDNPDFDDNTFYSAIHVQNNIFVASSTGLGVFYLGATDWNWGRLDRSLPNWTMNNNIFYYTPSTRNFLYSPPPTPEYTKNFANGKTQFGDTTSLLVDPMFNDPANKDFSLKPGSPAIGAGSNGTTPGAF